MQCCSTDLPAYPPSVLGQCGWGEEKQLVTSELLIPPVSHFSSMGGKEKRRTWVQLCWAWVQWVLLVCREKSWTRWCLQVPSNSGRCVILWQRMELRSLCWGPGMLLDVVLGRDFPSVSCVDLPRVREGNAVPEPLLPSSECNQVSGSWADSLGALMSTKIHF